MDQALRWTGDLDDAVAMAVSPIGSTVFVTGNSRNVDTSTAFATVAYAT